MLTDHISKVNFPTLLSSLNFLLVEVTSCCLCLASVQTSHVGGWKKQKIAWDGRLWNGFQPCSVTSAGRGHSASRAFWPRLAFFPPALPFVAPLRATFDDAADCCSVQLRLFAVSVICFFFLTGRKHKRKAWLGRWVGGVVGRGVMWTKPGINKWKWNGNQRALWGQMGEHDEMKKNSLTLFCLLRLCGAAWNTNKIPTSASFPFWLMLLSPPQRGN